MRFLFLQELLSCVPDDEFVGLRFETTDSCHDDSVPIFYRVFVLKKYPCYTWLKRRLVTGVYVDDAEKHLVVELAMSDIDDLREIGYEI